MSSNEQPHRRPTDPAAMRRELRDLEWRIILGTGGALIGLFVITFLTVWGAYDYFAKRAGRANAELEQLQPLATREAQRELYDRIDRIPPPRLEALEPIRGTEPYAQENRAPRVLSPSVRPSDLQASRQQRLTSYGWVDQQKGIVHIPIEQAMDLLVKSRKLPALSTREPANPAGLEQPESFNSGRGGVERKP